MTCEGTVRRCFLHVVVFKERMLHFLGLFSLPRRAVAAASFVHAVRCKSDSDNLTQSRRKPRQASKRVRM